MTRFCGAGVHNLMDLLATCERIVEDYESWLDAAVGSDAVNHLCTILLAIVEHED